MTSRNQPGTVDELTSLYRETIVRHAVHPVGFEAGIEATHSAELFNPFCGDRIEVNLLVHGDAVEAMAFRGEACAICMASASIMCGHQAGRPAADLRATHAWLDRALNGQEEAPPIEDLLPLLGVRAYPSRVRCALLPWEAAIAALPDA